MSKFSRKFKWSVWHCIAPLCVLPLVACGQTQVQQNGGDTASAAAAPEDVARTLSQKLEGAYQGQNLKVLSVHTTPIAGLFEVVVTGNQILYVDQSGQYMLVGDLVDIAKRKSLTEERLASINHIDFSQLPKDEAIKEVRGNGKRVVAVFGDPDCPFCKRLEAEFEKMTDVTIYTYLMPIPSLHPQAADKSVQIWCQKDRTAAWNNWMRHGVTPPAVPSCPNPVADTMALGEKLGFTGTPTMVFPNGKVMSGYMSKNELEIMLDENQK